MELSREDRTPTQPGEDQPVHLYGCVKSGNCFGMNESKYNPLATLMMCRERPSTPN